MSCGDSLYACHFEGMKRCDDVDSHFRFRSGVSSDVFACRVHGCEIVVTRYPVTNFFKATVCVEKLLVENSVVPNHISPQVGRHSAYSWQMIPCFVAHLMWRRMRPLKLKAEVHLFRRMYFAVCNRRTDHRSVFAFVAMTVECFETARDLFGIMCCDGNVAERTCHGKELLT